MLLFSTPFHSRRVSAAVHGPHVVPDALLRRGPNHWRDPPVRAHRWRLVVVRPGAGRLEGRRLRRRGRALGHRGAASAAAAASSVAVAAAAAAARPRP